VVGSLVPDDAEHRTAAFSIAGHLFQKHALEALETAGLPADLVLSLRPVPSFPRGRRLWYRGGRLRVGDSLQVDLLPVFNLQPVKSLLAGLSCLCRLLVWSTRHRGSDCVLLAVNLSDPPGLFTWFAARLSRSRLVGWILDIHEPGQLVPDTLLRHLDVRLHRWLVPRLDGLVVVADQIARDFAPGRPYLRIEGGVDGRRFAVAPQRPSPDDGTRPLRMLFAGSLEPFNGVDLLLESLALLGSGVELTVAGAGSLEERVRSTAARDPRLRFLGMLPADELPAVYGRSDLLLNIRPTRDLTTRYYFPSKLIEYLASGCPTLSTCTGHVEEELGGFLFLLRDETPQGLASRVREIAATPAAERERLGRRARQYVLEEKSWEAQGRRLADYLRQVAVGLSSGTRPANPAAPRPVTADPPPPSR
jgi:glycosyltransferase involved in cell wall biosynthesis